MGVLLASMNDRDGSSGATRGRRRMPITVRLTRARERIEDADNKHQTSDAVCGEGGG